MRSIVLWKNGHSWYIWTKSCLWPCANCRCHMWSCRPGPFAPKNGACCSLSDSTVLLFIHLQRKVHASQLLHRVAAELSCQEL